MKTLTIKLDERTKAGKRFIAMAAEFKDLKEIEIIDSDELRILFVNEDPSPYNP